MTQYGYAVLCNVSPCEHSKKIIKRKVNPMNKTYYIYIMASRRNGTIYTGVTNNLVRRVGEHKNKVNVKGFSARYDVDMLVYYECFGSIISAIQREKQLKKGNRDRKMALIEKRNPEWRDLWDEIRGKDTV